MWLEAPDIAGIAQPGQFITVCCEGLMLRRPFSIHQVVIASEAKQSQIAILFQVVGKGTLWLSQCQRGDKVDILGPLGNGFSLEPEARNLLLVAGGIGIAPLVFLMQRASSGHSVTLIQGASTASKLYPLSLLPLTLNPSPSRGEGKGEGGKRSNVLSLPDSVRFVPVTEDGTMGKIGMVTDTLPDFLGWADRVYACGPIDMYKRMSDLICHSEGAERSEESHRSGQAPRPKNLLFTSFRASAHQGKLRFVIASEAQQSLKKCQVSLEVRMGCGIGACYGCSINTKGGLKKVCRDGPIFELDDILWEEVRI
jgi:dihydroorotate dehydrogenase electron transfer subunit